MIGLLVAAVLLVSTKGAKERANSTKGQLRRPNLDRYYGKKAADLNPGHYTFRATLIRTALQGPGRETPLDPKAVLIDWTDEGDAFTANATLRRPFRLQPGSVPIERGDGIRLETRWSGQWKELWTLWVRVEPEVNLSTGEVSCELGDELFPLKRTQRDWEFKSTKKGPKRHGWTADEVAREVGKVDRVRIGKLAKGTKRFEMKKVKKASGLEVIRRAYAHESNKTGRKFLIRMKGGKLDVLPLTRPGTLYVINGVELEAELTSTPKNPHPATVIEAKGRLRGDSGKDAKLKATIAREKAVRRFGRVVKQHDFGRVKSQADLETQAKRLLAGELKVTRSASITMPGIPFLEKGSTIRWVIGEPGWHGTTTLAKHGRDKSICFVTASSHSLSPEAYTTTVQVNQEDVYYEAAKQEDEEARKEKRRKRDSKGKEPKK